MRLPTFLFVLCSLPVGLAYAASNLIIENATVRQPLPGKTVSAGYFTVTNPTAQPVQILAANSSWFGKTELHQHRMVDGMMRMEQVKQIASGIWRHGAFATGRFASDAISPFATA